ncbi:transglycosylase SLT domain-containing protein [Enterococcus italicus]|uniref:transglycosylase SLT domain-containing protein n=1 Tax=Enterococcus italicus TaxID=246144 RepID=UPI0020740128|nr:transglycosylase SLT domain-containing protein [Enterococcus italicus]MCM6932025.1 transglycosylase SLT domain-containing protein [Enterococcus italicus]
MELEELEVLIDVNTERAFASMEKFMPTFERIMGQIEKNTSRVFDRTENAMDMSKGLDKLSKQTEQISKSLDRSFNQMKDNATTSSEAIGNNFAKGIKKARPKAAKEIDEMVKEMDAKMRQAGAAQEKIAFLQSQRSNAASKGNSGKVVQYDSQIAQAQAAMVKYHNQAKGIAKSMKMEFEAVPGSLDAISNAMLSNEGQIELLRKRITNLREQYKTKLNPTGSFSKGFKNVDTGASIKTAQTIEVQSAKMNKLINTNDRLQREYAQTEDRANSLRKALMRINTSLGQSSMQTGSALDGVSSTGSGMKQSERAVSKYGGIFNRMSNSITHGFGGMGSGFKNSLGFLGKFGLLFSGLSGKVTSGSNRMARSTGAFGQALKYLLPSLIVYNLLGGAISKLSSGMMSALKTNDQFANSLNQIKVNLLTAFYPIYTAIMPALNALMSALATLTGQFASFIANMFGTTYQAAKQGAQGLYDNVQAMGDTGSAASKAKEKVDKLQRSLMGFDEINRIGLQDNSDTGTDTGSGAETPSVDFNKATGNYTTPAWMKNLQKLAKEFFKPFQDAWKNQGQKVIDAWKYALGEVIGLASSIGKSFMEVWTNGTGQRFIENLLILLADVLNIVGDIAKAFKDAWNDNGRGTALIQSIFDKWNAILELLHEVAKSFREAWNDGTGEAIAANLLEIYTNLNNTVKNLADNLKNAWTSNETGRQIFSTILGIVKDLLGHINNMSKATENWAKKLDFTPLLTSIKKLLESIRPLTDKIGGGLEWFYKNVLLPLASYSIQDLIPAFLDGLSGAIKVLDSTVGAFGPSFSFLWDNILKPIASWTGGVIVDVLKGLGDVLSTIGDWLDKHGKGFSDFLTVLLSFGGAVAGIVGVGIAIEKVTKVVGLVVAAIAESGGLMGALGSLVTFLGGPITVAIAAVIAIGVLLWKNWDTIKEKASDLGKWISEKWQGIKDATSEAWDSVKKWSSEKWEATKKAVSDSASNAWNNVKTNWGNIKTETSNSWSDISSKTGKFWGDTKSSIASHSSNAVNSVKSNWNNIKSETSNAWDNIKSATSSKWENVSSSIGSSARNAWSNMSGWWSRISQDTSSTFDTIVNKARSLGSNIGSALSSGWSAVWSGAKSMFDGMVKGAKAGVNAVLSGVRWVLNAVGAHGTANSISDWAPAYAKGTNYHPGGLALVNDGSGSNYREMYQLPDGTTGLFPKQRNMMVNLPQGTQVLDARNTAKLMGAPAYASGIFGSDFMKNFDFNFDFNFGDWFSSAASTVSDVASNVWDWVTDKASIVAHLWDKIGRGNGGFGGIAGSIVNGIKTKGIEAAKDFLFQKAEASTPPVPAGSGVERWRAIATKALRMESQYTPANLSALLYQMQTESGGNPSAINNWDINAKNGVPSQGLMQVIPPTFAAYARPGYNRNILDPLSNILASIRYTLSRYGSLTGGWRGVGYAKGTSWLPEDQIAMIHKGEMIVPASFNPMNNGIQLPEAFRQTSSDVPTNTFNGGVDVSSNGLDSLTSAIMLLVQSLGAQANQTSNGDIVVNIGGKEFGRIAVSEINKYHAQIGRTELNI